MCRKKILEKFLAIILIFTLTFANFAFITKSYASSFAEVLFGVTSDTGSKSVNFDAYFDIEGEHYPSVISDVNYKSLFINMDLDVKDKGYLKDAKIEFVEGEEGKNINFIVKEEITEETEKTENEETNSDEQNVANEENVEQGDVQNQETKEEKGEETSNESSETPQQPEENQNAENSEKNNNEQGEEANNNEQVNEESDNEEPKSEENNEDIENEFEVEGNENTEEVAGIEDEATVEDLIEAEEHIEKFEENVFYLNQIDATSEMRIQVPIEYQNEQYINEEKVSGDTLVVFSGVYVNNKGEEEEVSKQVKLTLGWRDNREVDLNAEMTKYIDYGAGVILQTVEKVNSSSEENTLPVKSSELEITAPLLKDVKPSKVTVVANTTKGTNGEEAGSVNFSEDNWNYNEEENKLTIKVNNEKQKVEVNYNPDEYLQDAEKEIVEEERYYNGSGIDEFLVTYTYENVEIGEEALEVNTDVTAKMTTLSGLAEENIVTNSKEYNYELKEKSGDIVSLNIENKKEEISKAYTYVNYNNEGKYETEIPSEIMVNVSYKDIVEGIEIEDRANTYVDKEGNEIANNDIYYKTVGISKENFESILGENGEIKVKDEAGNVIFTINKETEVNEAGQILVGFAEKYTKLSFEMSKPEGEGNLVISVVKAIANASVDKGTYANIDRINSKTGIKANYSYVEGITELGEVETNEKLLDTATEANIVIDRESLSTVEENKDVEIRVELNNAKETSDVYGNSVYEIELPENVETVELTNVSLLYGEGLEIVDAVVEGRVIRVTIEGKQEGINSGVLTNGTNIVLNANIKVNIYTPAKSEVVKLRYNNSEATNYVDGGYKEVGIAYSAPTGLVAVTRISNYDNEGSIVESVRQGKKEGIIPVYGEARVATSEIVVMNNHNNTISNMSILGRIPYAGVKDIKTGEELGTTIDSKMASGIAAVEGNRGNFVVYYSENGEATRELDNEENGWTREPASLENIKSYLIVPEDENYVMEKSEILRFTYNYEIPENLPHNQNIYGTFGVFYKNNSELSIIEDSSIAELVGLSTGIGPELSVSMNDTKAQVKENEEFEVKASVRNVGKNVAENVRVEIPIPAGATYSRYEIDSDNGVASLENNTLVVTFEKLEVEQNVEIKVYLVAKPLSEEGEYSNTINPSIKVTAKDLATELTDNSNEVKIEFAEFYILEEGSNYSKIEKPGNEVYFKTTVMNSSTETKNNVVVTKVLPKEFNLVSAEEPYNYDEATRTITWNIGSLEKFEEKELKTTVTVNQIENTIASVDVKTSSIVTADNSEKYESNAVITTIAKPVLSINQTTDSVNTYLKEGDAVTYNFNIKNEGGITARNVKILDEIPDGIIINKVSYLVGDVEVNKEGYFNDKVELETNIEAGEEWKLKLEGEATSLGGADEQSVSNVATVSSDEITTATSNSITHIIEASNDEIVTEQSNGIPKSETSKTYRITGVAWIDKNQDGMRNEDEDLLAGIVVRLVNSETGVISQSITTDAKGAYSFSGVQNGNYLVLFEYDTVAYKVTAYQKEGVLANVNSDVITTTIEQDGKTKEGAVTDVITIKDGSVSNIDIGLVYGRIFDLKLDKAISKITVQTAKKTSTENYNNVSLAKAEIAAKNLSGSEVYVEYTITVSNVGDISGYAKKIVDYIPEGMTFNSSLDVNSDWYTGSDGNLYTDVLENMQLKSDDSVSIKLVLTKHMTEENTGLVNNIAEIYEDYNTYGVPDINSTPANKAQGENDMGTADTIIAVKTGEALVYTSIIIITILLGSIAVFVTHNKIVAAKRKGGV